MSLPGSQTVTNRCHTDKQRMAKTGLKLSPATSSHTVDLDGVVSSWLRVVVKREVERGVEEGAERQSKARDGDRDGDGNGDLMYSMCLAASAAA